MQLLFFVQSFLLVASTHARPGCHLKPKPSGPQSGTDVNVYGQGGDWDHSPGSHSSSVTTDGVLWSKTAPTPSYSVKYDAHGSFTRGAYWNSSSTSTHPSTYSAPHSTIRSWSSSSTSTVSSASPSAACSNDDVLSKFREPALNSVAVNFCSALLQSTITTTVSATATATVSVTSTPSDVHVTSTVDVTVTQNVTVTATSSVPDTTVVLTSTVTSAEIAIHLKRDISASVPAAFTTFAPSKLASACSCLIGASVAPATVTSTALALTSDLQTVTASASTVVDTATSTIIQTVIDTTTTTPPAKTATSLTTVVVPTFSATDCVPAPGQTRAAFRIEGATDTIFEGFACAGPVIITTPSGGTHLCDGTNDNSNPTPGGTATGLIQAAGSLYGFDFDGTFSSQFDDYFITRIGSTAQEANDFWGILSNDVFTPAGGCQTQYSTTDEILWAFNAFNVNGFLKLSISSTTISPGGTVVATVTTTNGDGGSFSPAAGATVGGQTTSSDGTVSITINTPGVYLLKATKSNYLRSNGVYVTVQ